MMLSTKMSLFFSISFDLSQAIDTLHPAFLSDKIAKVGLRGSVNGWLLSFLTNRKFMTRVGSAKSDLYCTSLGTPQGSVLGPLLFLLYINDLPEHLSEGKIFAYADDIALVVSGSTLDGVCRGIDRAIDQFRTW